MNSSSTCGADHEPADFMEKSMFLLHKLIKQIWFWWWSSRWRRTLVLAARNFQLWCWTCWFYWELKFLLPSGWTCWFIEESNWVGLNPSFCGVKLIKQGCQGCITVALLQIVLYIALPVPITLADQGRSSSSSALQEISLIPDQQTWIVISVESLPY